MKSIGYFILLIFLWGCKDFETKKLSSEELLEEELKELDWNNLDTYPDIKDCESYSSTQEKKHCFEREITGHIYQSLSEHEVTLKDSIYEKIYLSIKISTEGQPSLEEVKLSDRLEYEIPDLKDWLHQSIRELPQIYPGEKRGVPVTSEFKLPLIIQSETPIEEE